MRIDFHRSFDKAFSRLNKKQKHRLKERLVAFVEDSYAPELNNHPLRGKYQGYRSINITGNIRAIFIRHSEKHAEFIYAGTHDKLYGK